MPLISRALQNSEIADTEASTAILLIGDYQGIDEVDAQSVALLIAQELRKQGISISDPVFEAPAAANVYRVAFIRLGEKIQVRLTQENPLGTSVIERQLWIANIEEMIMVAPRLVDALLHEKPISSTIDIESVTEHEARVLKKIKGESLWHFGFLGLYAPGTDILGATCLEFGWSYEVPSYAVGTQFRFRYQEEADKFEADGALFSFFSWSIGGRYFLNKKNISPYVGGGLALIGVEYETKTRVKKHKEFLGSAERYRELWGEEWEWVDEYNSEGANGLGAYAAVGIEFLRLSQSRLNLELRVDRTFFRLTSRDVIPITLGIFYSMNYVPGQSGCRLF
jgi:hypothetical protein